MFEHDLIDQQHLIEWEESNKQFFPTKPATPLVKINQDVLARNEFILKTNTECLDLMIEIGSE